MNIDPVCGMEVDEKESSVSQFYKGRAYFFCSDACFRSFSADPEKCLQLAADRGEAKIREQQGGYFSRLIKRLGRHAEKSPPPKCH